MDVSQCFESVDLEALEDEEKDPGAFDHESLMVQMASVSLKDRHAAEILVH